MAQQLTINLEQSLTEQFPEFMDCVRASVYDCGKPFKAIAADLDMSVSELSRRIAKEGDISLLMRDLPRLIRASGDKRPVLWLAEMFIENSEAKRDRLLAELSKTLPRVQQLVKALGR